MIEEKNEGQNYYTPEQPEQVVEQPAEELATNVDPETGKKVKKPKSKLRKTLEWVFTGIFVALFAFFAIGQLTGMIHRKENYGQTLTYGYGAFVIQTNSMEPEYKVKTAIITHKESVESIVKKFDKGEHVDITFWSAYVSNNAKYDYPLYRPGNITYGGIEYQLDGHEPTYPQVSYAITHRLIEYHIDNSRELGKGRYTFVVAGINTEGFLSGINQYQLLTENEILGIVKVNSPFLGGLFQFITSPWGLLVFLLVPAFYLVITSVLDIFKALKEPEEENASSSGGGSGSPSSGGSALDGLSDADRERLKKDMLDQMLNKKGGKK